MTPAAVYQFERVDLNQIFSVEKSHGSCKNRWTHGIPKNEGHVANSQALRDVVQFRFLIGKGCLTIVRTRASGKKTYLH